MNSTLKIASTLQEILDENQETKLMYNPYFRISKSNSESLQKYNSLYKTNNEIFRVLKRLMVKIDIGKNLLTYFLGGIFLSHQYRLFQMSNKDCKVLFVSHATNNNLAGNDDVYFANLPIISGKDNCTILYLNHSRKRYRSNHEKLIKKNNCANALLVPKFLRPSEFLGFVKHSLDLRKGHILALRSYGHEDSHKKRIILDAINWIFMRDAFNNYLLTKRLLEIQKLMEIEKAFFTFEGHSYEELLSYQLKRKNPKISLFLYQHSPITKAHSGVQFFLKNLKFNLTILTTGKNYSKYLSTLSSKIEVVCIGSIKKFISREPRNCEITSILVAPEGTKQSALNLIKVMIKLSRRNPHYHFILRLHPNLKMGLALRSLLLYVKKLKNTELSKYNLELDLNRTQVTFYVGSTVAIQALSVGNLPVFINLEKNKDLNVMSIINESFPIIEIQENGLTSLETLKNINMLDFNFNVSEDFFSAFNLPPQLEDKLKL